MSSPAAPPRRAAPLAVVVLVAVVLGACGSGAEAVELGPGIRAEWREVEVEGATRRYLLASPEDRERGPGVVVLHGAGTEPRRVAADGGWLELVRSLGVVLALPEGRGLTWDAEGCCAPATERAVADVAFLRQVADDVADEDGAEGGRVHVAGHSNGAMMAYRLLCEAPEVLAGAAAVAGSNTAGCRPERATPFLHVHGRDDRIVPLGGGATDPTRLLGATAVPPVPDSLAEVARAMGCEQPTDPARRGGTTTVAWAGCPADATVALAVIDGAGHAWPPQATDLILGTWGLRRSGSTATPADPPAATRPDAGPDAQEDDP